MKRKKSPMPQLARLRVALASRNIQEVARETGIHANALYRLMAGGTDPKYETVRKLHAYLTQDAEGFL